MEYPYMRKSFHDGNKNTLLPILGMTVTIFIFTLWLVALILFYNGSHTTRAIIVLIYAYQLIFADKNPLYIKFFNYCKINGYFKSYTLIIEEELCNHKVLLCTHPHGILSLGMGSAVFHQNSILKNFVICGTRFVRYLPISGILARWVGIQGVNHQNFKRYMSEGKNIILVPGGFECATFTNHRKDRVFLKNRKGFIKYSLRYGYKVYPCYNFNENKLYYTFNGFEKIMYFLNKLKIPGCFFIGKFFFYPRTDVELCTVIGKPLELPVIPHPKKEDVDKYHLLYIHSLVALYNRYKSEFGCSETLELI
jgi:hypothetical protein